MIVESPERLSHGDLIDLEDGTWTYIPDAGFVGLDSFTYHLIDASGSISPTSATVFLNVLALNHSPQGADTTKRHFQPPDLMIDLMK